MGDQNPEQPNLPQMTEEQQRIVNLEAQVMLLTNELQNQQNAQASSGLKVPLKLKSPKDFKGAGDSQSAGRWLQGMARYLDNCRDVTTDEHRIVATSCFLDGPAQGWWQQHETDLKRASWDEFKAAFLAYFQPVNASDNARAKLYSLRQRGGGDGFDHYCAKFNDLLSYITDPPMEEKEQLTKFMHGLMPETKKYVMLQRPKTFREAQELAALVEEASKKSWREERREERDNRRPRRWNRPTYNHNPPEPTTPGGDDSGPAAMELGMHKFEPERRSPKPNPSRQARRRCHLCSGIGHFVDRCPELNKAREAIGQPSLQQPSVPRGGSAGQTRPRN